MLFKKSLISTVKQIFNKNIAQSAAQSNQSQNHTDSTQIASNTTGVSNTNICPKCGAHLVLRTARKGENAGKQFYGCSAFPACRYTKNIE